MKDQDTSFRNAQIECLLVYTGRRNIPYFCERVALLFGFSYASLSHPQPSAPPRTHTLENIGYFVVFMRSTSERSCNGLPGTGTSY